MTDDPSTELPPPPEVKPKTYNRGGGRPHGSSEKPITTPLEAVNDVVVELKMGAGVAETATKFALEPAEVRRIQSLVNLTPQVFFEKLADRFEDVLDAASAALLERIRNGEGDVKTLSIAAGVYTDKLLTLRGRNAPSTVNQTIVVNGMSREDAKKFLLTGDLPSASETPSKP